jgi:hypothetical protein
MNEQSRFAATDVEQRAETSDREDAADATETEVERTRADPTEGEQRALPLDQTFEILKNRRRRCVLQYLNEVDGPVSLSELAEQIAAWENGKDVRQITSSERKRVYVGLYQCHLPKMAGMDVVSFNKPRGVIERGENADCFEPYLQRNESPRNRYQVGLAILGIGLFPAAVLSQTAGVVPLVATALVVCALAFGTAFWLAREGRADDSEGFTHP